MDCHPGPPDQICQQNRCVAGCKNNTSACSQGMACNLNSGRCEPVNGSCNSDDDCGPPAHICESHQCIPGCGSPGGLQCSSCDNSTGRCSGTSDATVPIDAQPGVDAQPLPDATTGMDASVGTVITVAQAVANPSAYSSMTVTLQNVVVVSASTPSMTPAGTSVMLYVQDPSTTGAGLGVYRGRADTAAIPSVGDVVTVTGHLSTFNGSLQISSSSRLGIMLSISRNGSGGTAMGGAYSPAGTAIRASAPADYASNMAGNHANQVGNVLVFSGPLTVTNAAAFVNTDRDGGTHTEGFAVTGGLWVDDSFIYKSCIAPLDGGVLHLPTGIRGVWDRYQDYYAGSAANPAPTVPVLFPMSCADLMP
jgi:hypothetical protein